MIISCSLKNMKKILAYVSPEEHASLFDVIVAHDAGADVVVPYHSMDPASVREIVYSATFTRHPVDLENTAIFVGGHEIEKCEALVDSILKTLDALPSGRRVSVALDPDGSYTTASASVVKIKKCLNGRLSGSCATVIAGTGPVGQMTAVLLAKEGCGVNLASRSMDRAERSCHMLQRSHNVEINPLKAKTEEEIDAAISHSDIVVSAGPEGVMLLPKRVWSQLSVRVLADLNAIPPYGIEGVEAGDDCKALDGGQIGIGALAVGRLKMRCHHELVGRLFKEKGVFFDLGKVYRIAGSI